MRGSPIGSSMRSSTPSSSVTRQTSRRSSSTSIHTPACAGNTTWSPGWIGIWTPADSHQSTTCPTARTMPCCGGGSFVPGGTSRPELRMRSGSSSLMTTRSKSGRRWWRAMHTEPTTRRGRAVRAASRAVCVDVANSMLPHVGIDDVGGGAMAARHLLDAGHRHIAFVGDVEENPFGFASSERRLEGFRAELEAAGVDLPPGYVKRGPFGRATAGRLTRQLLSLRRRPTAVFAASDVQAFGVLDAAARAGLSVPEDLSVIGFDDIELAAAIGLTTVRQPLRESGRAGAGLLLSAIDGDGVVPATALPELA